MSPFLSVLLQVIGGGGYLLQKIFLAFGARAQRNTNHGVRWWHIYRWASPRSWQIWAWSSYLVGLPAWTIIFALQNNWIASLVEASGGPSMALGLLGAIHGEEKKAPRWLDWLALGCVAVGMLISWAHFGGITTLNQWLEIAMTVGFLVGTYLLAKKRRSGYLWYIPMNISCAWLLANEGMYWMIVQQTVSLAFTLYAYVQSSRKA